MSTIFLIYFVFFFRYINHSSCNAQICIKVTAWQLIFNIFIDYTMTFKDLSCAVWRNYNALSDHHIFVRFLKLEIKQFSKIELHTRTSAIQLMFIQKKEITSFWFYTCENDGLLRFFSPFDLSWIGSHISVIFVQVFQWMNVHRKSWC